MQLTNSPGKQKLPCSTTTSTAIDTNRAIILILRRPIEYGTPIFFVLTIFVHRLQNLQFQETGRLALLPALLHYLGTTTNRYFAVACCRKCVLGTLHVTYVVICVGISSILPSFARKKTLRCQLQITKIQIHLNEKLSCA